MLAGALLGGFIGALSFGLMFAFDKEFGEFAPWGFGFGFGFGLPFGLAYGRGGREPKRVKNWRAINLRRILAAGLAYGIGVGPAGFFVAFQILSPIFNVILDIDLRMAGLMAGLLSGLMIGLPFGFKRNHAFGLTEGDGSPQMPPKNWRQDLAVGLTFGLPAWLWGGLLLGLEVGLGVALTVGLVWRLAGKVAVGLATRFEEASTCLKGRSKPGVMTACLGSRSVSFSGSRSGSEGRSRLSC
jgi:hypothetical protein